MISADMKQQNRKIVFDLVRRLRTCTRVELAELTGMSGPSIMAIVNEFLEKGILTVAGKKSGSTGRSPLSMVFNPDVMTSVGIAFEGNHLAVGLVNLDGDILFQKDIVPASGFEDRFFEDVYACLDEVIAVSSEAGHLCRGIGFGIPGVVDADRHLLHFAPHIGIRETTDIADRIRQMESHCRIPVFIENDVNACAIGEYYLRRMHETLSDMLYVSAGTGVGAGIILDGRLRHGNGGLCGEIGYFLKEACDRVTRESPGWLEKQLAPETLRERFPDYVSDGVITEEMVAYIGDILSPVIANLVNALDVTRVIVGGRLLEDGGERLLKRIQIQVANMTLSDPKVKGSASSNAGVIGSAMLASDKLCHTIL